MALFSTTPLPRTSTVNRKSKRLNGQSIDETSPEILPSTPPPSKRTNSRLQSTLQDSQLYYKLNGPFSSTVSDVLSQHELLTLIMSGSYSSFAPRIAKSKTLARLESTRIVDGNHVDWVDGDSDGWTPFCNFDGACHSDEHVS